VRSLCLLAMALGAFLAPSVALAADPPLATTEAPSEIGDGGATLNGKVNPKGSAVSVCRFEYGTTAAYGAALPCIPASVGTGGFNVAVSADLDSLEAGTTYHYRVIASSVNGATQGADRTFTTTGSPACPNADRRLEQGILAIQLPDCMALEQVNPSVKGSQRAASPTISADGQRIAFRSLASFAGTPGNLDAFNGDRYVATRGEDGWIPVPTVPPAPYSKGWDGGGDMARSFDPSLTRWVVFASSDVGSQYTFGIAQLFRGSLGGPLEPISPLLDALDPALGNTYVNTTNLQGASADLRRLLLAPGDARAVYFAGDPVPTPNFDKSIYLAQLDLFGNPSAKLATRDETGPDAGKVWGGRCGARVGDVGGAGFALVRRTQGAVALDGSRVFLTTRASQEQGRNCDAANKLRILERTETAGAAEIEELIASECVRVAPACPGIGTGNLTAGSNLVTGLTTSSGQFAVGMPISGVGVAAGATVASVVSPTEITLSANATATGSNVPLGARDGSDFYQGASVDQSKLYFSTNRQLADTDVDGTAAECNNAAAIAGCDLYLYDADKPAGERLTQVSAGEVAPTHPVSGQGANVYNGTVAISGDGSHVYFAATGVLTADPNPAGQTAAEPPASTPKLYAWDTESEEVRFVGALAAADLLWGGKGTFFNNAYPVPATGKDGSGIEVGGRGDVLVFQTGAALTANDTDGAMLDTFRYDGSVASPTLVCVSCKPGGPDSEAIATEQRGPAGQFEKVGTAFAEENRWVSEDGKTILIRTNQALVPSDVNGTRNDYLWREGKPTMLPGTDGPASALNALGVYAPVLSHDGSLVAFNAYSKLLPSDIDSNIDVYVARPGGGFPFPEPEPDCEGEACQGTAQQGPAEQGAASEGARSPGNFRSEQPRSKRCAAGKRKVTKNGKTRCAKKAKRCPAGKRKVTKNGKTRCVKKEPAKRKKGTAKQRAKHNRGGQR
jgi:WD40-like Beta Propeller Repeat